MCVCMYIFYLRLRVRRKPLQAINKVRAIERIPTNTHTGALPEPHGGGLSDGFVCQGTGARDNANVAFFVDAAWHDADFALFLFEKCVCVCVRVYI